MTQPAANPDNWKYRCARMLFFNDGGVREEVAARVAAGEDVIVVENELWVVREEVRKHYEVRAAEMYAWLEKHPGG